MAIVANKVPGIRAVCLTDPYVAERASASLNAQIATLGQKVTDIEKAKEFVKIWLTTDFQGGAPTQKVEKIGKVDGVYRK